MAKLRGRPRQRLPEQAIIAEQTVQALDMAKQGYTYKAIAAALNLPAHVPRNDILHTLHSLAEFRQEIGAGYVDVQLAALDEMILAWHARAKDGDKDAATIYMKALEQRAKLLGLGEQEADTKPTAPIILGWQGPGTLTMQQGDTSVKITGMPPAETPDSPESSTPAGIQDMSEPTASERQVRRQGKRRIAGKRGARTAGGHRSQSPRPPADDSPPSVISGQTRSATSKPIA